MKPIKVWTVVDKKGRVVCSGGRYFVRDSRRAAKDLIAERGESIKAMELVDPTPKKRK